MDATDRTDRLVEVVRRYGQAALTDPVALRAALRETGASFTESERDALTAVAGSAELTALLTGAPQVDAATDHIAARTELPTDRVRWAWATMATALRPAEPSATAERPVAELTLPPREPTAREFRVTWEGEAQPLPARRRGRWLVGAAVLVVAALAAAGVVWFRRADGAPPPPPDRYAVDQIALRYRALGERLLDGVQQCAQLPAQPGEVERVGCAVGIYTLTLASYDAANRLAGHRDSASNGTDIVRTVRLARTDAAVVMQEVRSGHSTVYWDIDSPRPVSATLTADGTGLPALVAFYDSRRFGGIQRPPVPGPTFKSGVLWAFAAQWISVADSPNCVSVPLTAPDGITTTEKVDCPQPDGSILTFGLVPNSATLTDLRKEYSTDAGKVPGSVLVTVWNRQGGPVVGQYVQFVGAADHSPGIYFDEDATLAYGTFLGEGGTPLGPFVDRWKRANS